MSSTSSSPSSPFQRGLMLTLVVVSVLSLYESWSTHERMRRVEQELVRRQQDESNQLAQTQLLAKQSDELSRETAARAALQEARINDLAAQRVQLDELLQSLSSSRDENLLSAVDASLRVAQQQAALTGGVEPMLVALQSSQERLARAKSPRLDGLRRAMSRDIDRIKATPVADVGYVAAQLDDATRAIDDLPLLIEPPTPREHESRPPAPTPSRHKRAVSTAVPLQEPAAAAPTWWESTSSQMQASAAHGLDLLGEQLLSLVRLTRVDHPEAALIAPDQAMVLRTNLKLRLLNARLAVMSRQFALVRADLGVIDGIVDRYFDPSSRKTQSLHKLLQDVQSQLGHAELPRPDDSQAVLRTLLISR